MGIYRDQLLPRIVDKACSNERVGKLRAMCLDGISGTVVEPGFGSGTNLPYYPPEVTKVYAVDPAVVGRKLAADRITASGIDVEFIGLDGQSIPLPDDAADAGVLTFSLCTIPDPQQALAELRRVIRPGGSLHFCEHGLAPEPSIQRWQYRLDPLQGALFDGCHVTRDHRELITEAGFEIDWIENRFGEGPKFVSYFYIGQATNRP